MLSFLEGTYILLKMFMLYSYVSLDEIRRQFNGIAFTFNYLGYEVCDYIFLLLQIAQINIINLGLSGS